MGTRAAKWFNPRAAVTLGASVLLVAISAVLLIPRIRNWPIAPDLTAFWAGA